MLRAFNLGVMHERAASPGVVFGVCLSDPYRLAGVAYPVRELSWCSCGWCAPFDDALAERWRGVAAACTVALFQSSARAHRRRHAAWLGDQLVAQAEVAEALHRQLLVDLRAAARRQGLSA
jgi:hypothetical protein